MVYCNLVLIDLIIYFYWLYFFWVQISKSTVMMTTSNVRVCGLWRPNLTQEIIQVFVSPIRDTPVELFSFYFYTYTPELSLGLCRHGLFCPKDNFCFLNNMGKGWPTKKKRDIYWHVDKKKRMYIGIWLTIQTAVLKKSSELVIHH